MFQYFNYLFHLVFRDEDTKPWLANQKTPGSFKSGSVVFLAGKGYSLKSITLSIYLPKGPKNVTNHKENRIILAK